MPQPAPQPQYLDDNGEPMAAATSTAAPVYLDDNGNPAPRTFAYESPGSGSHAHPHQVQSGRSPGAGGFLSGLGDQLGVTPTALRGTMDAVNPVAQFGQAGAAIRGGHYGDAFNRALQGGLDLFPGGGLAIPALEHLASDPYELIQRGDAETSPVKRAGYAGAALVPVLGKQAVDAGELFGADTPEAVAQTEALRNPLLPAGKHAGSLEQRLVRDRQRAEYTRNLFDTTTSEGTGRTVGLLAPLLVSGIGSPEGESMFTKRPTPTFNPAHIRQTAAERSGNPAALAAENVLEKSLPGSIPFRAHRMAALTDASRIGTDLANSVSNATLTPEQLGNVVISQIARGQRLAKFKVTAGDPLDRLASTKPEAIPAMLTSDKLSLADVRTLNKRLGPDTMRAMAAQNIREVLEDFVHSRNPQMLAKSLRDQMGDGKLGTAINNPQTVRAINQFIDEAEKTPVPKGVATSPLSGGNIVLEAFGLGGHMLGAGVGAPVAAGAFYGAARMATSPAPWIAARNALGRAGNVAMATGAAGAVTRKDRKDQSSQSSQSSQPNHKSGTSAYQEPRDTEFRALGGYDENDSMLMRREDANGNELEFPVPVPPSRLLPPQFKNARNVMWGSPVSGSFPERSTALGKFGQDFNNPSVVHGPGDFANTAQISKSGTEEPTAYAHETYHAVYERDLTPAQKQQFQAAARTAWTTMHNALVKDYNAQTTGGARTPVTTAQDAAAKKIPQDVLEYVKGPNDELGMHEAFAELGAQYMANPSAFRSKYPDWYGMMKEIHGGREYIHARSGAQK